jgi:hypothetical protein
MKTPQNQMLSPRPGLPEAFATAAVATSGMALAKGCKRTHADRMKPGECTGIA